MKKHEVNIPLVCICIPTYNVADTIGATINSIINQTYSNIVVKIVDNASTDATLDLVRTFISDKLELIENDTNIGGEGNFNRCIELCCGDYTAIFHADDVYEPDIIQKQVAFLKNNMNAGAVLTEATLINDDSMVIGSIKVPKTIKSKSNVYSFLELFEAILEHSNFLVCPSALVRTDVYKKSIKSFSGKAFGSSADLDVWLRVAIHSGLGILPLPLINYRISSKQFSTEVRRSIHRADFFKVMDFYLKKPFVHKMVTDFDRKCYAALDRRDSIMRAVNLCQLDKFNDAYDLCLSVLSTQAIMEAIKNKRGKFTLIFGGIIILFHLLRMDNLGKKFMKKMIRYFNK